MLKPIEDEAQIIYISIIGRLTAMTYQQIHIMDVAY
jgi:hypothetical protein